MTGNWPGYVQKTTGSTELDQGRTHNPVNEIIAAAGTDWADPMHDRNGNMTTIPKPVSLAECGVGQVREQEIQYFRQGTSVRILRR